MTQTLLVLGARSDMGLAVAEKFASQGFNIQLAARRAVELQQTAKDLQIKSQQQVSLHEFDVLNYTSHDQFIDSLPVLPNIVLCVVGLLGEQKQAEQDWNQAEQIIASNYTGPVSILNRIAERFDHRHSGCIIGVSSVAGDRGRQSNYLYGSAKAGFTAYLSGLRNRLFQSGVQVITVKPGFVNTSMTAAMDLPKLLTAQPEQVADQVYDALMSKKHIVYSHWYWRWIMLIIKLIPERIFIKLTL